MRGLIRLVFASLAWCVMAEQAYQSLIPNGANVVRNGVAWPAVGHTQASSGFSGNVGSFGSAFGNAGHTWTTALCNADSDGDGYTNGMELGDPNCVWTPGGAAPSRTTGISHPGYADSTPTVATTAAPPTPVPTTAAPPTPVPTTATPPTPVPTTAAPPTTTTTPVPTTAQTSAIQTTTVVTSPASSDLATTTTTAPATSTTNSAAASSTIGPSTSTVETTTNAPSSGATSSTNAVSVTSSPPASTTTTGSTSTVAPGASTTGLTTNPGEVTTTSTGAVTTTVGTVTTSVPTTASTLAPPPTTTTTPTMTTTTAPSSPVMVVARSIASSPLFPVLGGAFSMNWTLFANGATTAPTALYRHLLQSNSAALSDLMDVTLTWASAKTWVAFGVADNQMTGTLVACYLTAGAAPTAVCLDGEGVGTDVTWATPATTAVLVVSWSATAGGSTISVRLRCPIVKLGVQRDQRQRFIVAHGTVVAGFVLLGHGATESDRGQLVVDAYSGTLKVGDDMTLTYIALYTCGAIVIIVLAVAAALNFSKTVVSASSNAVLRACVGLLFVAMVALVFGMAYTDHLTNLSSSPVGRSFGDATMFSLWFVLYPVPKHGAVAFIAGSSYERLVVYHALVGSVIAVVSTLHMALMLAYETDLSSRLFTWEGQQPILAGFIAWLCFVVVFIVSAMRPLFYKIFRATHLLIIPGVVFASLHYPPLAYALAPPVLNIVVDVVLRVRSGLVSADRITSAVARRGYTMLTVRLTASAALPGAGQFVLLGLSASGCAALYPHPVSVAWVDEATREARLFVKSRGRAGSWSADLLEAARATPTAVTDGSVVWYGPYGRLQVPLGTTPTVVLVAGGVGITAVLSILQHVTMRDRGAVKRLVFLFSCNDMELLQDVSPLIGACARAAVLEGVDTRFELFVTHAKASVQDDSAPFDRVNFQRMVIDQAIRVALAALPPLSDALHQSSHNSNAFEMLCLSPPAKLGGGGGLSYHNSDENATSLLPTTAMTTNAGGEANTGGDERVALYCCGPSALMDACAAYARVAPGTSIHTETFDL